MSGHSLFCMKRFSQCVFGVCQTVFSRFSKNTFLGIISKKFKILVQNFRATRQLVLRIIRKNLRSTLLSKIRLALTFKLQTLLMFPKTILIFHMYSPL